MSKEPVIVPINGVIGWDFTASDLRKAMAEAKGGPIEFQINSGGGIVFDGLEMYNMIREYPGETTAITTGLAASMASIIPLAAKKVKGYSNSTGMIHNAWGIAMGTADDMLKEAEILSGLSTILADIYARKTGKSAKEIKAAMNSETWLFGNELLEYGLIDELIDAPEDSNTKDKPAAMASAKLARANAERIVREFDGGDKAERVALLIETMIPKAEIKEPITGVAGSASPLAIKKKGSEKMTLETLKAEQPDAYQAALAEGKALGIKAERDRMAELSHWKDVSPACASIVQEAEASGKSFSEVQAQLSAAAARGPGAKGNDNAPIVGSAEPFKPVSVPDGLTEKDVSDLMASGMTMEQIKANAPKGV